MHAKENSGYLVIRAIFLHSSKGDTESTEFEMQEGQNTSTRIRQSLPRGSGNHLARPVKKVNVKKVTPLVLLLEVTRTPRLECHYGF